MKEQRRAELLEFVKQHHGKLSPSEIAQAKNVSNMTVYGLLKSAGIHTVKYQKCSKEETARRIKFIKENPTMTCKQLAVALDIKYSTLRAMVVSHALPYGEDNHNRSKVRLDTNLDEGQELFNPDAVKGEDTFLF